MPPAEPGPGPRRRGRRGRTFRCPRRGRRDGTGSGGPAPRKSACVHVCVCVRARVGARRTCGRALGWGVRLRAGLSARARGVRACLRARQRLFVSISASVRRFVRLCGCRGWGGGGGGGGRVSFHARNAINKWPIVVGAAAAAALAVVAFCPDAWCSLDRTSGRNSSPVTATHRQSTTAR